jgi:hypothetical protein
MTSPGTAMPRTCTGYLSEFDYHYNYRVPLGVNDCQWAENLLTV